MVCVSQSIGSASAEQALSARVRSLLSDNCFQCHGPDEQTREAGLRLDTADGVDYAFAPADEPDPDADGEGWYRVTTDDPDLRMPPPESGKTLSADDLKLLRAWIDSGATWTEHWAFVPPAKTDPPKELGPHPIDAFVRQVLQESGGQLNREADRATLLRRLSLDLIGLPPTVQELDAFLEDSSPAAYEHAVDRLLSSPHYGEQMAAAWLDGARYADTNGYQNDFKRSMWPWRDWVISAFNANMPFDQFTVEQIAGDLLPDATLLQRVATGFNRNNRTVTEAGSIPEEWLTENVVDRVETTSAVFLGLTMGCARCHDHKYDPVSQREFYEFFAFFNNVDELGVYQETRGNVDPLVLVPSEEQQTELDRLDGQVQQLTVRLTSQREAAQPTAAKWLQSLGSGATADAVASAVRVPLNGDWGATSGEGDTRSPSRKHRPETTAAVFGNVAKVSQGRNLDYGDLIAPGASDQFTISLWVKPEKPGALVAKMGAAGGSRGFDIRFDEGDRLAVHLVHSWPDSAIKVRTKRALPTDRWSHVTLAYDGSSKAAGVTIRVDGRDWEAKAEFDSLTDTIQTTEPFTVGRRANGNTFTGQLYDLRYFDRLLTEAETEGVIADSLAGSVRYDSDESLSSDYFNLYQAHAKDSEAREARRIAEDLERSSEQRAEYLTGVPTVMVMKERSEPRATHVLKRGQYDLPDLEQRVQPNVPSFLPPLPDGAERNRLGLARWLVDEQNPLTARVTVNRLWQQVFGVGLVKTSENFGVQADAPSHPELLDWLAVELIESGWDVKAMLKLIVTSDTYRQSSWASPEAYAADPENRLLARGPRRRLPAEAIRDNALAVGGLLDLTTGGPSIKPYQPEGLWDELAGGANEGPYVQSTGEELYRRSLYIYRKRTVPHPTMSTFDAPSWEICQIKRDTTNTPLQALALLNDVTYLEAGRKLGERMLSEASGDDADRLGFGFRLATGRKPSDRELQQLGRALSQFQADYSADPEAAAEWLSHGAAEVADAWPADRLAAYAAVGSLLLNLDETMTKE